VSESSTTGKRTLFVTGTSRSGTTVFADFLRNDSRILMGRERYSWIVKKHEMKPDLFSKERFCFGFSETDSHHKEEPQYYRDSARNYDSAAYVGDKIPNLFEHYDHIFEVFPDAKVLYLLRAVDEVASSFQGRVLKMQKRVEAGIYDAERMWPLDRNYRSAVAEWNLSLRNTLGADKDILILNYQNLFLGRTQLKLLYEYLGLQLNRSVKTAWKKKGRKRKALSAKPSLLSEEQSSYVHAHAHYDLYEELRSKSI
jgi:hypothetical protein